MDALQNSELHSDNRNHIVCAWCHWCCVPCCIANVNHLELVVATCWFADSVSACFSCQCDHALCTSDLLNILSYTLQAHSARHTPPDPHHQQQQRAPQQTNVGPARSASLAAAERLGASGSTERRAVFDLVCQFAFEACSSAAHDPQDLDAILELAMQLIEVAASSQREAIEVVGEGAPLREPLHYRDQHLSGVNDNSASSSSADTTGPISLIGRVWGCSSSAHLPLAYAASWPMLLALCKLDIHGHSNAIHVLFSVNPHCFVQAWDGDSLVDDNPWQAANMDHNDCDKDEPRQVSLQVPRCASLVLTHMIRNAMCTNPARTALGKMLRAVVAATGHTLLSGLMRLVLDTDTTNDASVHELQGVAMDAIEGLVAFDPIFAAALIELGLGERLTEAALATGHDQHLPLLFSLLNALTSNPEASSSTPSVRSFIQALAPVLLYLLQRTLTSLCGANHDSTPADQVNHLNDQVTTLCVALVQLGNVDPTTMPYARVVAIVACARSAWPSLPGPQEDGNLPHTSVLHNIPQQHVANLLANLSRIALRNADLVPGAVRASLRRSVDEQLLLPLFEILQGLRGNLHAIQSCLELYTIITMHGTVALRRRVMPFVRMWLSCLCDNDPDGASSGEGIIHGSDPQTLLPTISGDLGSRAAAVDWAHMRQGERCAALELASTVLGTCERRGEFALTLLSSGFIATCLGWVDQEPDLGDASSSSTPVSVLHQHVSCLLVGVASAIGYCANEGVPGDLAGYLRCPTTMRAALCELNTFDPNAYRLAGAPGASVLAWTAVLGFMADDRSSHVDGMEAHSSVWHALGNLATEHHRSCSTSTSVDCVWCTSFDVNTPPRPPFAVGQDALCPVVMTFVVSALSPSAPLHGQAFLPLLAAMNPQQLVGVLTAIHHISNTISAARDATADVTSCQAGAGNKSCHDMWGAVVNLISNVWGYLDAGMRGFGPRMIVGSGLAWHIMDDSMVCDRDIDSLSINALALALSHYQNTPCAQLQVTQDRVAVMLAKLRAACQLGPLQDGLTLVNETATLVHLIQHSLTFKNPQHVLLFNALALTVFAPLNTDADGERSSGQGIWPAIELSSTFAVAVAAGECLPQQHHAFVDCINIWLWRASNTRTPPDTIHNNNNNNNNNVVEVLRPQVPVLLSWGRSVVHRAHDFDPSTVLSCLVLCAVIPRAFDIGAEGADPNNPCSPNATMLLQVLEHQHDVLSLLESLDFPSDTRARRGHDRTDYANRNECMVHATLLAMETAWGIVWTHLVPGHASGFSGWSMPTGATPLGQPQEPSVTHSDLQGTIWAHAQRYALVLQNLTLASGLHPATGTLAVTCLARLSRALQVHGKHEIDMAPWNQLVAVQCDAKLVSFVQALAVTRGAEQQHQGPGAHNFSSTYNDSSSEPVEQLPGFGDDEGGLIAAVAFLTWRAIHARLAPADVPAGSIGGKSSTTDARAAQARTGIQLLNYATSIATAQQGRTGESARGHPITKASCDSLLRCAGGLVLAAAHGQSDEADLLANLAECLQRSIPDDASGVYHQHTRSQVSLAEEHFVPWSCCPSVSDNVSGSMDQEADAALSSWLYLMSPAPTSERLADLHRMVTHRRSRIVTSSTSFLPLAMQPQVYAEPTTAEGACASWNWQDNKQSGGESVGGSKGGSSPVSKQDKSCMDTTEADVAGQHQPWIEFSLL